MGEIISGLKRKSETFVQVSRFFPSTQICDICENRQEVPLSQRVFTCLACGNEKDRDIHSAVNIKNEGLKALRAMGNTEHAKTPAEPLASADIAFRDVDKPMASNQEVAALCGAVVHQFCGMPSKKADKNFPIIDYAASRGSGP